MRLTVLMLLHLETETE